MSRILAAKRGLRSGLETPLIARFRSDGRWLVFAPPRWYDLLLFGCIVGGPLLAILGRGFHLLILGSLRVAVFVGIATFLAGVWGAVSSQRMICDLRSRTYLRLQGKGFGARLSRGSLAQVAAVELSGDPYPFAVTGQAVVYRLILRWIEDAQPRLVVARESRELPKGAPLDSAASPMRELGLTYSSALGVPFVDGTQLGSSRDKELMQV